MAQLGQQMHERQMLKQHLFSSHRLLQDADALVLFQIAERRIPVSVSEDRPQTIRSSPITGHPRQKPAAVRIASSPLGRFGGLEREIHVQPPRALIPR